MPKFGVLIKIQENNEKNAVLVFGIEFYDFWWKPHLHLIKRCEVTKLQLIIEIQISRHMTVYGQTLGVFKRENN